MYVSGTLTVSFSDGTSKTISVSNVSANRLSFSAKKDNRTHMFNLASDNAFDMSTDNSFKMSSKAFDISGSNNLSISGGSVVAPVSGEVSGEASLPRSLTADIKASGTANFGSRGYTTLIRTQRFPGETDYQTDNSIAFNTAVSGNIEHYFNIYASRLLFSVLGGTINMERAVITFAEDTMLSISAILKMLKLIVLLYLKQIFLLKIIMFLFYRVLLLLKILMLKLWLRFLVLNLLLLFPVFLLLVLLLLFVLVLTTL